ncbi:MULTISPECIES: copper chaperone PCu(A)C [Chelativorans]|uniref:YncI copper-binding domain-containing protein n=1 Tax=Chelativorans sp. (strain BNC1) TaxID=266779 RepID=Q11LD7_CHESB|nr:MULTISPECIES: copper chaperone PCu(A)C [Chelativorans]
MRYFNLAISAAALAIFPSLATAHVSLEQQQAAPGTYKAVLSIPHGCGGEPTISVRVELPEGFIDAKPVPKPGWSIAIEEGNYARAYDLHGNEVSSGPVAITWSGGSLADEHYDEFAVRGRLANVEAGQRLYFKTVQTCPSGGKNAWVEEPAPGQDPHALEYPAPFVTIAAAESAAEGHHHGAAAISAGDVRISEPWARAMLPGQPTGGAYMTIRNEGAEPDRLLAVTSPAAGKVEIHMMEMKGEVMEMRPVEGGLEVPAGESVSLKPGGLHLMFFDVETPFAEGAEVPVTLEFEKAGRVELSLPVLPASTGRGGGGAHQH